MAMKYALLAVCFLAPSLVYGQEAQDSYTVEATTTRDGVFERRPKRVETLDEEMLERHDVETLADAMEWLSGATATQPTGTSTGSIVDGLPAGQVTVLQDGLPVARPVGSPTGPMVNLEAVPVSPSNIDRIEISRGMGPAGTSGVVVNIITKRPKKTASASVTGRLQSDRNGLLGQSTSARMQSPLGANFHAGLQGDWRGIETVDVNNDDVPDRPEIDSFGGELTLGWHRGRHHLKTLIAARDHTSLSLSGPDAPLDDRVDESSFRGQVAGTWALAPRWELAHESGVTTLAHDFHKLVRASGFERIKAQTDVLSTRHRLALVFLADDHDISGELDANLERIERTGETGELAPETLGEVGFTVDERWYVSSSAELHGRMRLAYADPFGPSLSAELGAAAELPADLVARISVSRTRRVPTAEELFLVFDHSEVGYRVIGNADLTPETLNSVRTGLAWRSPERHFGAECEGFFHYIQNGIVTDSVIEEPNTFTSVNAARLGTAGLNASVFISDIPRWFSARATYTYLPFFEDLDTHETLSLRAHHSVRVEGIATFFDRALEARVSGNGRSALSVPQDSPAAPAYLSLGAGLAWRYDRFVRLALNVENLLNQTNATWGPLPGTHASLSLSLSTH